MAATQSNRLVNGRLEYIDSLRGLAVLLMVMVHAAATWSPSTASQQSLIGYVAAGLGGLAAPLFVVLFGWSISKSELTNRKITVRAGVLFAAQILLNSIAPHLQLIQSSEQDWFRSIRKRENYLLKFLSSFLEIRKTSCKYQINWLTLF